jgi:hypothetical protein
VLFGIGYVIYDTVGGCVICRVGEGCG